jgi:hypothetical protein
MRQVQNTVFRMALLAALSLGGSSAWAADDTIPQGEPQATTGQMSTPANIELQKCGDKMVATRMTGFGGGPLIGSDKNDVVPVTSEQGR